MDWKRTAILFAVVIAVIVAGCANSPTTDSDNSTSMQTDEETNKETATPKKSGKLQAEPVNETPTGAVVVNASNQTVQQSHILKGIGRESAMQDKYISKSISGEEYSEVEETLQNLPGYSRPGEFGYYIRFNDTAVKVNLIEEQ